MILADKNQDGKIDYGEFMRMLYDGYEKPKKEQVQAVISDDDDED